MRKYEVQHSTETTWFPTEINHHPYIVQRERVLLHLKVTLQVPTSANTDRTSKVKQVTDPEVLGNIF